MRVHYLPLAIATIVSTTASHGVAAQPVPAPPDITLVSPATAELTLDISHDYMAQYSSAFSPTGAFTLIARRSGDGATLMLADIIPTADNIIVAQRHLNLPDMRLKFSAGPFLAWGFEFVVAGSLPEAHRWTRIPVVGGEVEEFAGSIENGGYYSDMFSPFLAALMPQPTGAVFQAPAAYPRADETVSIELDTYTILGREDLILSDGISCTCWQIEKSGWNGSIEHIWVDRHPPYVFRRVRDPGGEREFTSDLLAFQVLEQ